MLKKLKIFSQFSFLVFVIVITTCDLFTGIPRDDLLDIIDDEIAWANADRLNVRVAYPPDWGVSPQFAGLGDIRKGYEFELGFTPNPEYALLGWRAYKTADLLLLDADWMDNPARYLDNPIPELRPPQIKLGKSEDVDVLSDVSEGGGSTRVVVNITDPITLIPFCRSQPRIIRSTPALDQEFYGRSRPVTITFAAALDDDTVNYHPNNIRIRMQRFDENTGIVYGQSTFIDTLNPDSESQYYLNPRYLASERMIRIDPKIHELRDEETGQVTGQSTGPPPGSEITLQLGTGLKTLAGGSWLNSILYTWRIRQSTCFVGSWEAKYKDGQIDLSWTQQGADSTKIRVRRSHTHAQIQDIDIGNPLITSHTINVPDLVPNERFDIWIDLISDGESFLMEDEDRIIIWAASGDGMEITHDNPAVEITQANYATTTWRVNNQNAIYVLGENINALTSWIPIGSGSDSAFRGTFYGLDKTIVFPDGTTFPARTYMGFFGYLDGARIYDLNITYENNTPLLPAGNLYFGGIAGYAAGNTIISGSTVRSPADANQFLRFTSAAGSNDIHAGGLLGYMHNQVNVRNSISYLNILVNKTSAGTIHAGGITGYMNGGSITDSYSNSDITVTGSSSTINTGGLAGSLYSSANIRRSFARNRITVTGSGTINTGGIAGFADNSSINNTVVLGSNITSSRDAYRILGGGTASLADNHARGSTSISPERYSLDENGRDGVIVTATGTTAQGFWTGRGFNSSTWDFNSLGDADRAGHPLLIGISNQTVDYENIQKLPITKVVDPDNTKATFDGPDLVEPGDPVSFTVTPVAGYTTREVRSADTGGSDRRPALPQYDATSYSFIMPNYPVTVTAVVTANTYELEMSSSGSGTLTVKVGGEEVTQLRTDQQVVIEASPVLGWKAGRFYATDGEDIIYDRVLLSGDNNTIEIFTVPGRTDGATITLSVDFVKIDFPFTTNILPPPGNSGSITSVTVNNAAVNQIKLDDEVTIRVEPSSGWKLSLIEMVATPLQGDATNATATLESGDDPRYGTFTMEAFPFGTTIVINVTFIKITHSFTPSVTPAGSGVVAIKVNDNTVTGTVNAQMDDVITVTVNPANGWQVNRITFTGTPLTGSATTLTRTFTDTDYNQQEWSFDMPALPVGTIAAMVVEFTRLKHEITILGFSHTTYNGAQLGETTSVRVNSVPVTPVPEKIMAEQGDIVEITVTPKDGWRTTNIQTNQGMTVTNGTGTVHGPRTASFTMGGFVFGTEINIITGFEKLTHVVTPSVTPAGSGTVAMQVNSSTPVTGAVNAQLDDAITVTVNPNAGWRITGMTLTGGTFTTTVPLSDGVGNNNYGVRSGTFTMPGFSFGTTVTVAVAFEKITHTFTPTIDPNVTPVSGSYTFSINGGSFQPAGPINAQLDDTISIRAAPAVGWKVKDTITTPAMTAQPWVGDEHDTRTRTFTMGGYTYDTSISVTVQFEKLTHVINTSAASESGTVSSVTVNNISTANAQLDDEVKVTANPNPGWRITGMTLTGGITIPLSDGAGNNNYGARTGTFTMPGFLYNADVRVTVAFERITHTFTPTVVPAVTPVSGSYTFSRNGGTYQQAGPINAQLGDTVAIRAAPAAGWRVKDIITSPAMTNVSWAGDIHDTRTCTFTMGGFTYNTPISVTVEFEKLTHEIYTSITPESNGTLTSITDVNNNPITNAQLDDVVKVTVEPKDGWRITGMILTGGITIPLSDGAGNNNYGARTGTFTMPGFLYDTTVTVTVAFEKITHTFTPIVSPAVIPASGSYTFSRNGGGSQTGQISAELDDTISISAAPAVGWKVKDIIISPSMITEPLTGGEYETRTLTFTMGAYPYNEVISVTVEFEKLTHTLIANISPNIPPVISPVNSGKISSFKVGTGTAVVVDAIETEINAQLNDLITITAEPGIGWEVIGVSTFVDGEPADIGVSFDENDIDEYGIATIIFEMRAFPVGTEIEVTVMFDSLEHVINIEAGTGGEITVVKVDEEEVSGEDRKAKTPSFIDVTAVPDTGYRVSSMIFTGVPLDGDTITYTHTWTTAQPGERTGHFTMPALPFGTVVTIKAEFEKIIHSFNAAINVIGSGTYSFVVTDEAGTTYSSGTGGTITARLGDTVTITTTPSSQFRRTSNITAAVDTGNGPESITVSGVNADPVTGVATGSFVMGAYPAGSTISLNVTFGRIYAITANLSPVNGGTVSVATETADTTRAGQDEEITITASPHEGWKVTAITVSPSVSSTLSQNEYGPRTLNFTMPAADVTVTATFEKIWYPINKLSVNSGEGSFTVRVGTELSERNPLRANYDDTINVNAVPEPGWRVKEIKAEAVPADTNEDTVSINVAPSSGNGPMTGTFNMTSYEPDTVIRITVEFEKLKHIINTSITPESNGTLTSITDVNNNTITNAELGDVVKVTVEPKDGWRITGMTLTGGGTAISLSDGAGNNNYGARTGTFTMPGFVFGTTVTVTVDFEKITHKFTPTVIPDVTPVGGYYTYTYNGVDFNLAGEISAEIGDTFSIMATPAAGWKVKDIITTPAMEADQLTGEEHGVRTRTFTMGGYAFDTEIFVTVEFEKLKHTINTSITPESNGTLTSITDASDVPITNAELGDTVKVTVEPKDGWRITGMTLTSGITIPLSDGVDDDNYGIRTGTFTMPGFLHDTTVTVAVDFEKITHKFTPVVTPDTTPASGLYSFSINSGEENPAGEISAEIGDTFSIMATPAAGWKVKDIITTPAMTADQLTGEEHGARTRTFTMGGYAFDTEISVTVEFEKLKHIINTSIASERGTLTSITDASDTLITNAELGDTVKVTVEPKDGWRITGMTLTGETTISLSDGEGEDNYGIRTGTFTMPGFLHDTTVTVAVDFEKITHKFTPTITSASGSGSYTYTRNDDDFSPGEINAELDDEISIIATPAAGWKVKDIITSPAMTNVSWVGEEHDTRTLTFTMGAFPYDAEISVIVEFEKLTHEINTSITSESNGTLTSITDENNNTITNAQLDDVVKVTVEPKDGWRITGMTLTGETTITLSDGIGDENYGIRTGTFTMPGFLYNDDVRVTVAFEKITHKFTPTITSASGSGSYTYTRNGDDFSPGEINAELGDEISIIATPVAGWRVREITIPSGMTNASLTGNVNVESTSTFTMGAFPYDAEISVTVEFEKIPYTINKTINNAAGGSFTVTIGEEADERLTAYYDETISVNITPLAGYMVTGWTAVSSDSGINASGVESGTFGMSVLEPDSAIMVTVGFEKIPYTIVKEVTGSSPINEEYFTVTARAQQATLFFDDEAVTIADISDTYPTEDYFRFKAGTLSVFAVPPDSGDTANISLTDNTFNMSVFPVGTVIRVTVEFEQTYAIDIQALENGSRTITTGTSDTTRAAAGENITIMAVPDNTYRVENMSISSTSSATLNWTKTFIAGNVAGTAGIVNGTFTMPTSDVTGSVTFVLTYSITGANTAVVSINGASTTTARGAAGDVIVISANPNPNTGNVRVGTIVADPSTPVNWFLTDVTPNLPVNGFFTMPAQNIAINITNANTGNNQTVTQHTVAPDEATGYGDYKVILGYITDITYIDYDNIVNRVGANQSRNNSQMTIIARPGVGYRVSNMSAGGLAVTMHPCGNIGTFSAVSAAVTVTVTFEEIDSSAPSPNMAMIFNNSINTGRSVGSVPADNSSSILNYGSSLTTSSITGRSASSKGNRNMPLSYLPSVNTAINETNEQFAASEVSDRREISTGLAANNNTITQNIIKTESKTINNQSVPESTVTNERVNEIITASTETDIIADIMPETYETSASGSLLTRNSITADKTDESKNNITKIIMFGALGLIMLLGVFIILRYRVTKSKSRIIDNSEQ